MILRNIKLPENNSFFLFGARGTGKSTLLRERFADRKCLWIDLLDTRTEERFLRDPQRLADEWRQSEAEWVVVDEIQKLPKLLDVVHSLIESDRVLFALTGSSARKLKRGQANLLAGRAFTTALFPFTANELGDSFSLSDALSWGTLPKVCSLTSIEDKCLFLTSYADTYVKEEILVEQVVRNMEPFRKFLPVAGLSAGRPLNYSKIGRDAGVDPKSVERYFSVLEDTLLGFFVDSFHRSVRVRQRAAPKFYFFDVGVQRALAQMLDVQVSPQTSYFGDIFEAFLMSEIHRQVKYKNLGVQLSYLQSSDGLEIDLVMEKAGRVIRLIEIKSAETVFDDSLVSLRAVAKDFPEAKRILICREARPRRTADGIEILPWQVGIDAVTQSWMAE